MVTETDPRSGRKSTRAASLVDILDRTQGHLILKWNASRGAERLRQIGLTSLYCLIALVFMLFFAVESFIQNRYDYGLVLLVFAGLTICGYVYLRITGKRHTTNTFLVLLFAALCLFLLYTGGVGGTGPFWFYVFPIFALFVQRLWAGVIAVVGLFVITALLLWNPVAGFDPSQYSLAYKERFLAVYIAISAMAFLYAFLRTTSELVMDNLSEHLRELADTDDLTGLPNRRRIRDILYQEISRLRRGGKVFCVVLLDIDHFRDVNNVHGHDCGDNALKELSEMIKPSLRTQDVCARWDGEEFLILLPDTRVEDARKVADRIKKVVHGQPMKWNGDEVSITVSMGIREFQPLEELDDCIKGLEEKLSRAKADGGNRVEA